ncbi:MAG: hypothetical protein HY547_08475 [Elusimicrobia bacterium]|nr:hypothetical protein [Elusimicrobiota bacterium]
MTQPLIINRRAIRWGSLVVCWICFGGFAFFTGESTRGFKDIARKAKIGLENRQWNDALAALEQGKRHYPRSAKIRLALGYLYRQVNLLPQARENAQWAAKHSAGQDRDLSYRELAWINERMFLYEDALSALAQIKKPVDADWALQARLSSRRGEWAKALQAIERIQTASPTTHFWKGWCLWHLGARREAAQAMETSAALPQGAFFSLESGGTPDNPWVFLGAMARRVLMKEPIGEDFKEMAAKNFHQGNDAERSLPVANNADGPAWDMLKLLAPR